MFTLNLVCRDPLLRADVIHDLHVGGGFQSIASFKVPQEVNEILLCTNAGDLLHKAGKKIDVSHPCLKAFGKINRTLAAVSGSQFANEDFLDLSEWVSQLKVV